MTRLALAVLAALVLSAAPCAADGGPQPERRIPFGGESRIEALAVSKDGARMAELDEKGVLRILSVPDGNILASTNTALGSIGDADLFFSADGSRLGLNYGSGYNAGAALFDGRTAKGLKIPAPAGVVPLRLNSGLTVAAAWQGVFDLATGRNLADIHTEALSPDGRFAASEKDEFQRPYWVGAVTLRELPGGAEVWHRDFQNESPFDGFVFSPDGRTLAEMVGARKAVFVDARTGSELGSSGRGPSFVGLPRYSPDGSSFAMSDASEDLTLFSAPASPRFKLKTEGGGFNNQTMEAAAFSPDGRWLYAGTRGSIGRFNVSDGTQDGSVGPVGTIQALALSPDGKTLAALFYGSGVALLDVASGRLLHLLPTQLFASALAFSPDGVHLTACEQNGHVKVFDTSGKLVYTLASTNAQSAAFSPDGKRLLVAGSDTALYSMETGGQLKSFEGGSSLTAWAPDGKRVAIAALNKVVLWNPLTGVMVRDFTGLADNISLRALALSPDGKLVAAGDDHGNVTFWELGSAKLLRTVKAGDNEIETVRFMDGGRKLLAMSGNYSAGRRAALFDAATGEALPAPALDPRRAGCAVLGPGARTLLTCEDRALDMWRLAPEPAKAAVGTEASAPKRKPRAKRAR